MTSDEINTRNESIARFMGGEITRSDNPLWSDGAHFEYPIAPTFGHIIRIPDLYFHRSWDWLMPVIEKIGAISEYPVELVKGDWILSRIDLKLQSMFLVLYQVGEDNWSRTRKIYDSQVGDIEVSDLLTAYWTCISDFCLDYIKPIT